MSTQSRFDSGNCNGCPYNPSGSPNSCNGGQTREPLTKEDNRSRCLLILQAPGEKEWAERKPLTNPRGAGGRLQNSWLRLGKSRHHFDITNAVQCYPGKRSTGRDARPKGLAVRHCQNWLRLDIESKAYRRIVVFGTVARTSIERLGFKDDKRFVFLRHPTGGLRNGELDEALGGA